ncbi:MAG: helix-turn-helix domain-containing protein [Promicromonosporaceae bacterium]|nr:helix-turn-helix domain-containing protein [Promicromonosporaceae bacterium]
MDSGKRIAASLAASMRAQRITYAEVGSRIGRTPNYVWRRLAGDVTPSLDDVGQIAKALGLRVVVALEVVEEPEPLEVNE